MAAPTRESVTRTLNNSSGINYIYNNLALLRSKIQNRNRVYPADVDKMRQMYNSFIGHTHSYFDQHWIKFGNTSAHNTTSDNKDAETLEDRGAPVQSSVISGGRTGHRTFTDRVQVVVNSFRTWCHSHYHRVDDEELE